MRGGIAMASMTILPKRQRLSWDMARAWLMHSTVPMSHMTGLIQKKPCVRNKSL